MINGKVYLNEKWEKFLRRLAENYKVTLSDVVNQLCEWAFSEAEGKEQFRDWLHETYPSEEDAEETAREAGEEAAEEEDEEKSEQESDEHRQ